MKMTNILTKLLFAATLLLCVSANAADTISYGAKVGKDPAFLVRDFSNFSLIGKDIYGFERYGTGSGQLELGERSKVIAQNRSGVLMGKGLYRMGLEIGNGFISYQNRPDYEYTPGLSAGLKFDMGIAGMYIGPRAGYSYRKNGGNDIVTGGVASVQVLFVTANYNVDNYYNSKDRLEISSLSVMNKYNIEKQTSTALGDVYMISVRLDD